MGKDKNRYLYLLKNIGFLTIGNFSTKLLSFFLVPLYTSILSTADYGSYDLVSTTVSLLTPILTLNIVDGTLRYAIDKDTPKHSVFSIAIKHYAVGFAGVVVIVIINSLAGFFPSIREFGLFLLLQYATTSLCNILSAFARGIDKVKEVSIAGVLGSLAMILLNILFLVNFKLGLTGYFLANIIGILVQILFLTVSMKAWRYLKLFGGKDVETSKKMHSYSTPLIANNLAWWVNNTSDRYMVTWIRGVAENGIYSVAYKIPSILSILQSIFQQAWTLSAVKDFDSEDKNTYFTRVYNMLNFILVIGCSSLIIFDKVLARFLYANDFYDAWKCVPVLLMAMIFSGMANFIGGIFQAANDTKMIMKSTIIAAVTNIVLNFFLISQIGAMGAAIATMISNMVNWSVRLVRSRNYVQMEIKLLRDILVYILLIVQSILLFTDIPVLAFAVGEATGFALIVVSYIKEVKMVGGALLSKFRK